jgi:CHAD domain-containing protein
VLGFSNPSSLFRSRLHSVLSEIRGVREGKADAIHDARVGTRRLRELLPLVLNDERLQDTRRQFRRAGRILGQARELDVSLELLDRAVDLAPEALTQGELASSASGALEAMRDDLERERGESLRDLVKTLEQVDLKAAADGRSRGPRRWQRVLARQLAARARRVRAAVDHAAGIPFPNRLHRVRVEVKKLRYSLELCRDLGRWNAPAAIESLKRAQDVLGELHDWQVFEDRLGPRLPQASADEAIGLRKILRAVGQEIRRLHGQYLEMRGSIVEAARSAERAARVAALPVPLARVAAPGLIAGPLLAIGAAKLLAPPARRMLRRAG